MKLVKVFFHAKCKRKEIFAKVKSGEKRVFLTSNFAKELRIKKSTVFLFLVIKEYEIIK